MREGEASVRCGFWFERMGRCGVSEMWCRSTWEDSEDDGLRFRCPTFECMCLPQYRGSSWKIGSGTVSTVSFDTDLGVSQGYR